METKKQLIFGYTWEEISAAQQGKSLSRPLPPETQYNPGLPSGSDLALLAKHRNLMGLKNKGLYGVIDRLTRAGLI